MTNQTMQTKQSNQPNFPKVVKLARICWNTNGWVKPSGEAGKSEDPKTFECEFRFGFEEWLFDVTAKFGEYQYGFLQQLNSRSSLSTFTKDKEENEKKDEDNSFFLHLFTLSPYKNQNGGKMKLYVGYIQHVEVLDNEEQEKLYHHFFSTRRLTQMYNDVYDVGGKWPRKGLLNTRPEDIFNIKFKFNSDNVKLFLPMTKELDFSIFAHYDRYELYGLTKENSTSMFPKVTGNEVDINNGDILDQNGKIIFNQNLLTP